MFVRRATRFLRLGGAALRAGAAPALPRVVPRWFSAQPERAGENAVESERVEEDVVVEHRPEEIRLETEEKPEEVAPDEPVVQRETASRHTFQAETKRLLQIVAKSIYTDRDVFVRELLSNCSDAIEKQRFFVASGKSSATDPLQINIITNEAKRQIIFQDTGVGMSKEELVEHLGTIAGSGSKKFVEAVKEQKGASGGVEESIIGQFGVGFYSSFIVGDTVEVFSKQENGRAHVWISDGSGTFDVFDADNFHLTRGTRIVIHLRPEFASYARADEVRKIVEKYSNFISHPIFVNQDRVNVVAAIWARDRRELSEADYGSFYEFVSKSKTPAKCRLHLSLEVPLSLKALLYVPSQNAEMFGFGQTEMDVTLYSRRVLIKAHCKELLPNYLRFVKGVVDCDDLPLNISRESYQDSALIQKLRSILTKRVLRLLEEESRRSPEDYNRWHKDFHMFLKEGIHTDKENAETLLALSRFDSTIGESIALDEYIAKLQPNQKSVYYFLAPTKETARFSPYMEPFLKNEIPVLFISINVEEMLFRQMENYKGFKFVNVESAEADIPRELQKEEVIATQGERVPEEDITGLCMWVRNELQPVVTTVNVSKRLVDSPAVVVSQMTSGMRQMMAMMDQGNTGDFNKNLTLEINVHHAIIYKLNRLRKLDEKQANFNLRQLLDTCLLSAGIYFDLKSFIKRVNQFIDTNLDSNLEQNVKSLGTGTDESASTPVEDEPSSTLEEHAEEKPQEVQEHKEVEKIEKDKFETLKEALNVPNQTPRKKKK